MEPPRRRTEILDAALACFVARGIDGATIAEIRERAGATTGSVYHFFDGKDAIVAALYLEVLRDYQHDLLTAVRRHTTARTIVRGIVEQYLTWVERRPDAARFLLAASGAAAIESVEDELATANRTAFSEVNARLKPFVESGEIRRLPVDVLLAILHGAAEAFTRAWLAKKAPTAIARARGLLANAAWDAVRGDL